MRVRRQVIPLIVSLGTSIPILASTTNKAARAPMHAAKDYARSADFAAATARVRGRPCWRLPVLDKVEGGGVVAQIGRLSREQLT